MITRIAWLAILVVWLLSLLFSPFVLVGVLPFFAVIRNSRDDLAKKQDEW